MQSVSRRHHILKRCAETTADSLVAIGFAARLGYIAPTVATFDPEKERQRLADLYGGMADGELEKLAADAGSLSNVARDALQFELARRHSETALPDLAVPEPPYAPEPPGPVTLRRFRDLPEALLAKSVLDSASVECFLIDENTIRMNWLWSNLLGGIKLWVRPEDINAGELLDQEPLESFDVDGVGEYRQPRCPICRSLDVSFQGLMKRLAYATLWLNFPIPIKHVAWKCHSCGHAWEVTGDH